MKKLYRLIPAALVVILLLGSCELTDISSVLGQFGGNVLVDQGFVTPVTQNTEAISSSLEGTSSDNPTTEDQVAEIRGSVSLLLESEGETANAVETFRSVPVSPEQVPQNVGTKMNDLGIEIKNQGDLIAAILITDLIEAEGQTLTAEEEEILQQQAETLYDFLIAMSPFGGADIERSGPASREVSTSGFEQYISIAASELSKLVDGLNTNGDSVISEEELAAFDANSELLLEVYTKLATTSFENLEMSLNDILLAAFNIIVSDRDAIMTGASFTMGELLYEALNTIESSDPDWDTLSTEYLTPIMENLKTSFRREVTFQVSDGLNTLPATGTYAELLVFISNFVPNNYFITDMLQTYLVELELNLPEEES